MPETLLRDNLIRCSGAFVPVRARALLPAHHGRIFSDRRQRNQRPSLIVLHWTGGEGHPLQMFETLAKRELSVHFCIAANGDIYQFNDPGFSTTFHAGPVNDRSIGIEMVNYGFRDDGTTPRPLRERETQEVHGRAVQAAEFFPAQMLSMMALLDTLTDVYDIPREFPFQTTNVQNIRAFKGVCGHFHITRRKIDPGLQPFKIMRQEGYTSVGIIDDDDATGRYPYPGES